MQIQLRRRFALAIAVCLFSACSGDPEAKKQAFLESGNRYAEQKKWAEAIIEYRNAIAVAPRFGEGHFKLSEALIETGDVPGAASELIRAADLLPTRTDVLLQAGSVLLLAGQFDTAKLHADKVLTIEPRNVAAQILKANALAGLKDFQTALDEIEAAVRLDPERSASYTALGGVRQARGEMAEAETAYGRAVELAPRSAAAQLALANFLWTANRVADAESSFKEAHRLEPNNPLANRGLATFYLASDRAGEAEPYLKALAARDRADRLALADFYVMQRRYDEALKSLQPADGEADTTSDVRIRVAAVKFLQGKREDAHREVDAVLTGSSAPPEAMLTKARFLLVEGKTEEARPFAERATLTDVRSINAFYMLGVINTTLKRIPEAKAAFASVLEINPRAVAAQVRLADLELASGNAAASLQHAQDAVLSQPQNGTARLVLARAMLSENNLIGAERELTALTTAFPKWAAVQSQLGVLHLRKNDAARARTAYEAALALDPKSPDALAGLVALDLRANRTDAARARVDERVKDAPNDLGTLLMAARSYALMKDFAKAETLLKNALIVAPDDLRVYADLAQLYFLMGRLDDSRRGLEDLARREPKIAPQVETMAGVILQTQNRPDEAIQKYEQVLALDKRSVVAANNLAWMYAERGENLEAALQLALTAKSLMPEDAAINDTLGFVYMKRSAPDLAVPVLKQAVEKDGTNVRYRMRLGMALAKAGQARDARRELELALRGTPLFPETTEARATLSSLPPD
jgi:tetratricopeptide (TPR) repeat protein